MSMGNVRMLWWLVLAVVLFGAAACGGDSGGAEQADAPPVSTTATLTPSTTSSTTAPATPATTSPPATLPEGPLLESSAEQGDLSAGVYRTDLMPLQVAFDVPQPATLQWANEGMVVMAPVDAEPEEGRLVAVLRPTRFPAADSVPGSGGIAAAWIDPPDDFAAWAAQTGVFEVGDSGVDEVGGIEAEWWDVTMPGVPDNPGACLPEPCAALFEVADRAHWYLAASIKTRIWRINDAPDPMYVALESTIDSFDEWLVDADPWLAGLTFGLPTGTEPSPDLTTGLHQVGRASLLLVDSSRPSPLPSETGDVDEGRTIELTVAYPASERGLNAAPADGAFPLIIRAHGLGGSDVVDYEAELLAANGYVVAAVRFPASSAPSFNVPDYLEQPADVSFVLDQLLGPNAAALLQPEIDSTRIGLIGRSLGGATAYGLVGSECCSDDRIGAALSHGGIVLGYGDNHWQNAPMLIVGGVDDTTTNAATLEDLLLEFNGPAGLLLLESEGHLTWLHPGSDNFASILETSLAFFDKHLDAEPTAFDSLIADIDPAVGAWSTNGR